MTKVEEVARAIAEGEGIDAGDWYLFTNAARTAIEAMRVPTSEMVAAGDTWSDHSPEYVWGVMITAALNPPPERLGGGVQPRDGGRG